MLTPEQIAHIREWAASGNKERGTDDLPVTPSNTFIMYGRGGWKLNSTGLTIAALAEENERLQEALRQACSTAELLWLEECPADELDTMRKNRKELLSDG